MPQVSYQSAASYYTSPTEGFSSARAGNGPKGKLEMNMPGACRVWSGHKRLFPGRNEYPIRLG